MTNTARLYTEISTTVDGLLRRYGREGEVLFSDFVTGKIMMNMTLLSKLVKEEK